jgi:hypothetical protein
MNLVLLGRTPLRPARFGTDPRRGIPSPRIVPVGSLRGREQLQPTLALTGALPQQAGPDRGRSHLSTCLTEHLPRGGSSAGRQGPRGSQWRRVLLRSAPASRTGQVPRAPVLMTQPMLTDGCHMLWCRVPLVDVPPELGEIATDN